MSHYTAIQAVSRSLKQILTDAITNNLEPQLHLVPIDLRSPKEMVAQNVNLGVSLWLYRVTRNGYTLNNPPARTVANQLVPQPLPIDLYYLVTPIADDPASKQVLLGRVLQVFNDNAVLSGSSLLGELADETQALRLTLEALTLDELSKVWYALQDPYQLSVTYLVQLVTIDSDREPLQGAPVIERDARFKQILAVT